MSLLLILVRSGMWYNPIMGSREPNRWLKRHHCSIQGLFTASWCRCRERTSKQHKSAWRIETFAVVALGAPGRVGFETAQIRLAD